MNKDKSRNWWGRNLRMKLKADAFQKKSIYLIWYISYCAPEVKMREKTNF